MVWGGNNLDGRTEYIYLERYVNITIALPYAQEVGPNSQSMHHNACPYTYVYLSKKSWYQFHFRLHSHQI